MTKRNLGAGTPTLTTGEPNLAPEPTYPVLVQGDTATTDDISGDTVTCHALEDVEVTCMVVCLGRDYPSLIRVPQDYVCIRTYRDPPLEVTTAEVRQFV